MEEITENNKQWYYSLFSGRVYWAEKDEQLDVFQIPLKQKPPTYHNCKKCYGRFYTGYDLTSKYYTPCAKCLRKYADLDKMNIIKQNGISRQN
jgi:hypothetical protein